MSDATFALLLFSTSISTVREAAAGGVAGIVIDWENRDKAERQRGSDTEINLDTIADLQRVRAETAAPIYCRINGPGTALAPEIEAAIEGGASHILVPMVRTPREVEFVLNRAAGRCHIGILIETLEAVRGAADLATLPLACVYVGLNDLAIARQSHSIFDAVVDGTIDRMRPLFNTAFGFGGLTLPDRGSPVPCRLLIAEMARLRCSFSFLRRSFRRDLAGQPMAAAVSQIQHALKLAALRTPAVVAKERKELCEVVAHVAGVGRR